MLKRYPARNLLFAVSLLAILASCKKEKPASVIPPVVDATPTKLGLYEADSSIYKQLLIDVSQIGTKTVNYDFIFDTGSSGMVIDASGILPASMITSHGFTFTGDSTIVDGITITNKVGTIEYGDDDSTLTTVSGNLAYAPVTIGDANGNLVVKRLPFFMYYKAVTGSGTVLGAHEFDTFGVSDGYDVTFLNNVSITSPFSYFDPGTGLTRGIKMAALGTSNFSYNGTYEQVLSIGLTAADLSSGDFTLSQLSYDPEGGYLPDIPASVTYNGKTISTTILFDTGTDPYSYIEDATASGTTTLLANNSSVAIAATSGFDYSYTTTATDFLTYVENPSISGENLCIFGLEFFLNNEYLMDYTDHKLGVKNN